MIRLKLIDFSVEKLINIAKAARELAYAPYSGFKVGAVLLTMNGRTFKGCNIENVSYGLTICAERLALFKAISEGEREFSSLAVISNGDKYCIPCGACLQTLAEFGSEIKIFMCNNSGKYQVHTVAELLPLPFRK